MSASATDTYVYLTRPVQAMPGGSDDWIELASVGGEPWVVEDEQDGVTLYRRALSAELFAVFGDDRDAFMSYDDIVAREG